ncbi:MAG: phosphomannose isomerase type II C-terminal cupin domain, partial [bacterium]|nr:phosphomannose isomerase type II C-terminal cupin domain [bacterium]
ERPWGNFERFTLNEKTTVKILTIQPGESVSLQTHQHRDEFWRITRGTGVVRIGDEERPATVGDMFWCPRNSKHQISGGTEGIQWLEVSLGDFDEQDITRLEDRYGRIPQAKPAPQVSPAE